MSDTIPVEPDAIDMAARFEGFSGTPYRDPTGVPTIGYGSIWIGDSGQRVTMDTPPIDEATARVWLAHELARAARTIAQDVRVPLSAHETAALEDFIYNLGAGNFGSSTLLRKLNAGDRAGAAAEIDRWDHAGGRVLAGLLRRREAETAEFRTPDPAPAPIPAPIPAGGQPATANEDTHMAFSWTDFMASVAAVGEDIIIGAAQSAAPLAAMDPTHPVVTAAIEGGQIAGKALALSGVPLPQFASMALMAAQMFAPARMQQQAPTPAPAA